MSNTFKEIFDKSVYWQFWIYSNERWIILSHQMEKNIFSDGNPYNVISTWIVQWREKSNISQEMETMTETFSEWEEAISKVEDIQHSYACENIKLIRTESNSNSGNYIIKSMSDRVPKDILKYIPVYGLRRYGNIEI